MATQLAMDSVLREIQDLLYGTNYVVVLKLQRIPKVPGTEPERYVETALGDDVAMGGFTPVTSAEMLAEIEQCLRYAGDAGAQPRTGVLGSPRFEELLSVLRHHLEATANDSSDIWCFWLKEGYPLRPVYWDFAFVLAGPAFVEVLIGSASD